MYPRSAVWSKCFWLPLSLMRHRRDSYAPIFCEHKLYLNVFLRLGAWGSSQLFLQKVLFGWLPWNYRLLFWVSLCFTQNGRIPCELPLFFLSSWWRCQTLHHSKQCNKLFLSIGLPRPTSVFWISLMSCFSLRMFWHFRLPPPNFRQALVVVVAWIFCQCFSCPHVFRVEVSSEVVVHHRHSKNRQCRALFVGPNLSEWIEQHQSGVILLEVQIFSVHNMTSINEAFSPKLMFRLHGVFFALSQDLIHHLSHRAGMHCDQIRTRSTLSWCCDDSGHLLRILLNRQDKNICTVLLLCGFPLLFLCNFWCRFLMQRCLSILRHLPPSRFPAFKACRKKSLKSVLSFVEIGWQNISDSNGVVGPRNDVSCLPLGSQILYHYRISMMPSRFVLFIENWVLRCNCTFFHNLVACGILSARLSGFLLHGGSWFVWVCTYHNWSPPENEWINCVSLQICSRVSLEYVEEVFRKLFHQHCRMIQILLLPIFL